LIEAASAAILGPAAESIDRKIWFAHRRETTYWLRAADAGRRHHARPTPRRLAVNTYGVFNVANPCGGFRLSGFEKELGRQVSELYLQARTVWVDLS